MSDDLALNERQERFLVALLDGEVHSGRVFRLAFPDAPYRGRSDAGATRTLDGLRIRGLVDDRYPPHSSGRSWRLTEAGRARALQVQSRCVRVEE